MCQVTSDLLRRLELMRGLVLKYLTLGFNLIQMTKKHGDLTSDLYTWFNSEIAQMFQRLDNLEDLWLLFCDLLGLVLTHFMDERLDKNLDSLLLGILLSGPDLRFALKWNGTEFWKEKETWFKSKFLRLKSSLLFLMRLIKPDLQRSGVKHEDRKPDCAGQGTTIVCLGQDANSHRSKQRMSYTTQHNTTSNTVLTCHHLTLGPRARLVRRRALKPRQTGTTPTCNRDPKIDGKLIKIESLSEEMLCSIPEFRDKPFVHLGKAWWPAGQSSGSSSSEIHIVSMHLGRRADFQNWKSAKRDGGLGFSGGSPRRPGELRVAQVCQEDPVRIS